MSKNRRSKSKYPNLNPKMNLKRRQEVVDFDYIHKLNDEEKDWLNRFMGEYVNARFDEDPSKHIHDATAFSGEYDNKNEKKVKPRNYRQACENANNRRNHDIYALKRSLNGLEYIDDEKMKLVLEQKNVVFRGEFEDTLIEYLDAQNKKED